MKKEPVAPDFKASGWTRGLFGTHSLRRTKATLIYRQRRLWRTRAALPLTGYTPDDIANIVRDQE
jgi:hypothetical protein